MFNIIKYKANQSNATKDVAEATSRGAIYLTVGNWLLRMLGLISVLIVARILTPEDFGVAAMAVSVIALTESFVWLGLFATLIQHQNPTRKHYDTVWTLNLLLHLFITIAVFLLAPFAADYYNEPRIQGTLQVLALAPLLRGLANVGVVNFRRDMRFDWEVGYRLSVRIFSFIVGITAAIILRDYRALIIGMLFQSIGMLIMSYILHPYRPKFCLELWREFIHFSIWSSINGFATALATQSSRIAVGRYGGTSNSGFYSVAEDIVRIFTVEFSSSMSTSLLSGASLIKNDVSRMNLAKIKSASAVSIVVAPLGFGLAATAQDTIFVLLGEQWLSSGAILEVLAIAWMFKSISMFASPFLFAEGRVKAMALLSVTHAALFIFSLYLYVDSLSSIAVAYLFLWTTVVLLILTFITVVKMQASLLVMLIYSSCRPLLVAFCMYLVVKFLHGSVFIDPMPSLVFDVTIGASIYTLLLLFFWNVTGRSVGAERAILDQLKKGFRLISYKNK